MQLTGESSIWVRALRFAGAGLGGVCLASAFPDTSWAGLAWVGPALLLLAARGASSGGRWWLGWWAGWIQHGIALHWLWEIPVRGYPILGWLALVGYLALYPAAWLGVIGWWMRAEDRWRDRLRGALAAAAWWVVLEMVQARLLGGFPWNLLGASQYEMIPLIQIASVTGVYGLSFLVVWVSVAIYQSFWVIVRMPERRHGWLREIAVPGVVTLLLFGWGWYRVRCPAEGGRVLRVAVVQPSIPQTMIWDASAGSNRFEVLCGLTLEALQEPVDLVIWPEGALPGFLRYDPLVREAVAALARSNGVWMILGGDDAGVRLSGRRTDEPDYYNAAFLVSPEGRVADVYRKMRLVMFGEYIPWFEFLPFLRWFTPITGQYTPGQEASVFEMSLSESASNSRAEVFSSKVRAAPLICYEDVFPHLARRFLPGRPDCWVNLTNDGWFGESAAQWQHAANAVFRAVETGLPLVRCTNNGLTCWVDPWGRMRAVFRDSRGNIHGRGWARWSVPLPDPGSANYKTLYSRYGDWWGWFCGAYVIGLSLASWIRRKRSLTLAVS
ncbi:MAG: apolipoprotein N-acyltransferase [Verrucomicrobiota bacterium]|nr:apolipoprotein N-acyltransferase [Limisphaera sp.]MDW8382899.1 apolipoprotein N-acyltransferase [Verrucomicrobiota bacterium]